MRKAPVIIESSRLLMRRPEVTDAPAIFDRYASDPMATRFMAWPAHRTLADTLAFIEYSDAEWRNWPAGPFLIHSRVDGQLLGSTGFAFETRVRAITGYILARDAWGRGYATEALQVMVALAPQLGIRLLTAACHAEHAASARVLSKCGFRAEGLRPRYAFFPNLSGSEPLDALCFSLALERDAP